MEIEIIEITPSSHKVQCLTKDQCEIRGCSTSAKSPTPNHLSLIVPLLAQDTTSITCFQRYCRLINTLAMGSQTAHTEKA